MRTSFGGGLLVPTIATALALAALIALGTWQLERKAWKDALIATLAQRLAAAPAALPRGPRAVHPRRRPGARPVVCARPRRHGGRQRLGSGRPVLRRPGGADRARRAAAGRAAHARAAQQSSSICSDLVWRCRRAG